MIDACDALTADQEIVPAWASASPGYSSIVTQALGNQKIRYGMQQICGCTMLFVVSRQRVYLGIYWRSDTARAMTDCNFSGHYWEDRCFGKETGSRTKLDFKRQVTNFILNGFQAPGGPRRSRLSPDLRSIAEVHAANQHKTVLRSIEPTLQANIPPPIS